MTCQAWPLPTCAHKYVSHAEEAGQDLPHIPCAAHHNTCPQARDTPAGGHVPNRPPPLPTCTCRSQSRPGKGPSHTMSALLKTHPQKPGLPPSSRTGSPAERPR